MRTVENDLAEALDKIYWLERELEVVRVQRDLQKTEGKKMADETPPHREEKQDMIAAAKQLPPTETFSLRPRTFDEAFRFANLIASSSIIPKEFQNSPANVLIAVQLGMELGVPPMQAIQNIAVINGRPCIWGDLLPAIVYASGLMEVFDEGGDEKQATCTVKRRGFSPITRTFSMDDARRVLYVEQGKQMTLADKQTYKSYPRRMLQMRARAYAIRDAFPDVLKGLAIAEDIEDLETMQARDVTPLRTPQPKQEAKQDGPSGNEVRANAAALQSESSARVGSVPSRRHRGTAEGSKPAASEEKKPEPPPPAAQQEKPSNEPPAEKSQEDIVNECLLWIENAPPEQLFADDNWLMAQIKHLKGIENQLKVLRPFNNRRQDLNKQ